MPILIQGCGTTPPKSFAQHGVTANREALQELINSATSEVYHASEFGDMQGVKDIGGKLIDAVHTLAKAINVRPDDLDMANITREYEWSLEVLRRGE